MNNFNNDYNYYLPDKETLRPVEIFFNKYNRGLTDYEIIKMLINKFPEINVNNLVYNFVVADNFAVMQTMDKWVKDLQTQKIYNFDYHNLHWNNNEESYKKLMSYGKNMSLEPMKSLKINLSILENINI